jgi:hypothetical protein
MFRNRIAEVGDVGGYERQCLVQRHIVRLVFLSVLVTGVHAADAQDARLYAGVSGMWSTQDSVTPGEGSSIPTTGVGGTAFGVSGEFGGFVTRTVSLAVEASVPARFESLQETGIPFSRIDNRHRDLVFAGLFHFHITPTGPIRLAVIAGPSVIREDTLQSKAFAPFGSNFGPFGPDTSLTRWTLGVTVGADVGIQLSRRVQVVPQIRLHWVDRATLQSGTDNSSAFLGLSSWVVRPAVGVRVGF